MSAAAVESSEAEEGKEIKIETFDDILPYIGEAGRYQWLLFILLLPFTVVFAFLYFTQFFLTLMPEEHWCNVPELDGWNLTDIQKIDLSIPKASLGELKSEGAETFSRCEMYAVNFTEVLMSGQRKADPTWPTTKCQHGWSFNFTNIPYASIAAELEWVCEKTHLSSTAQSTFFAGSILGGFVFGYIADHYGRIPALVACNAVGFFSSLATVFANSFWSFGLCRFIVGTAFDNCFNILFIVVIEYVGPKYRTLIANLSFGIYFAIAGSILPWIAYWIADWRILSVVTAAPLAIAFAGPWIVPESARWYISKGKIDKAIEMFKRFERINGKTVKPEVYEAFKKNCENVIKNDKSHNNYTVLDLFKKPRLARITIMLIIYWFILIIVFDGHVWNMKLLHPDVFLSFSLAALTELPASILIGLVLDRWGRRWTNFLSLVTCGVFSFVAIFTPLGTPTMIMAIIARLGVNITCNIGFQYAAELLPTVVRAQGVSLIHIIGYFAHIVGPYIVYLADVAPQLPLIVLGLLSIMVAILTLFLPETLDQEIPESIQEGNDFGKDQSLWWIPCISWTPEKKKISKEKLGNTNAAFNLGSEPKLDSTQL